jgi:hypothetical protein
LWLGTQSSAWSPFVLPSIDDLSLILDSNLHSPERQLIELRMEHADLNAMIDRLAEQTPLDELMLRRLKKRRLALRDKMARLEIEIDGKEPA